MTKQSSATNGRNFRSFLLLRQFEQQEVGQRIAHARKEAGGMTQEQLAALLNVSTRSVQDYEAGITVPWRYFQLLEEIFKRPLGWFLHGEAPNGMPEQDQLRREVAELRGVVEELVRRLPPPRDSG